VQAKNEASSNETTVVSVQLSACPSQGIIRLVHVRAPDTRKLRVTRYPAVSEAARSKNNKKVEVAVNYRGKVLGVTYPPVRAKHLSLRDRKSDTAKRRSHAILLPAEPEDN